MHSVLTDLLQVIGSIGVFIYGMKIMSEGLQKAAGKNLRHILQSMTNNRLSGIFTGLLTTIIVQSSSAITVMVVSFVNAGLLTFAGAIGVIMGANIGTTITAWLTLFSFKIEIQPIAIALIGIFFPFLFSSNERWRNIAEFVMGFGNSIDIKLDMENGMVSIRDYGRGIPLGKVIDCVSKINTGGKYDSKAFKKSVGLNGVGTIAVNALSNYFKVQAVREGKTKVAEFNQGNLDND